MEFDGPDPKKYQVGHIIATALEQSELTIGEDVDIAGSDQIISTTGNAAESEARKIGLAANATAVIWGYMGTTKEAPLYASFVPVRGEVGLPMMFGGSAALTRIPINGLEEVSSKYQLAEKLGTLVRITVGLARMQRGDFDGFAQEMDQAIKSNPANNQFVAPGYLFLYHAISRILMYDIVNTRKDLSIASNERKDYKLRAISLSLEAATYAELGDFIKFNSLCVQVHQIHTAPIEATSLCGQMYWEFGDEKDSSLFLGNILASAHPTLDELPSRIGLDIAFCDLNKAKDDLEYARKAGVKDLSLLDVDLEQTEPQPESLSSQGILLVQNASGYGLLRAAYRYTQMHNFDLASLATNELIQQVPSVTAYAARATVESLRGDTKHSIQDLNQAISREPRSSFLYELRAIEYDDEGLYNEELDDLNIVSNLDPYNAEVQSSIASALFSVGKKREGYKHLRNALSLEPTYAGAYFQLGTQQYLDGAYSDAIHSFTTEIDLIRGKTPPFGYPLANPSGECPPNSGRIRRDYYVSALVLRASAEISSRHYSSADHDLQEALNLDPSAANTHAMNSVLAEHENDYQRALAEIDKAIALDGREKQYKLSRERILQEMKAGK